MLAESGHGMSMLNVPSVLMRSTEYDSTETAQPDAPTLPTNGDVAPAATKGTMVDEMEPAQSRRKVAATVVPAEGAGT